MSFPARNSRTDAILPSSDIYRALSHREKKNPSANLSLLDQEQSLITLGSFQPTFIATRVLWGLCSGHGYTSTHRHALSTNALLCLSCCRIRTEEGYKHLPVTAASITSLLWPRKSLITVRLNMKAEKQNVYESVLYIHALSMQLIYQSPSTVFKNTCSSASTTKKRLPCSCFFPPPKKEEFLTSLLSEPCKEQTLSPLAEEFSLCVSFLWCIQLQGLEARLAGSRDALYTQHHVCYLEEIVLMLGGVAPLERSLLKFAQSPSGLWGQQNDHNIDHAAWDSASFTCQTEHHSCSATDCLAGKGCVTPAAVHWFGRVLPVATDKMLFSAPWLNLSRNKKIWLL